MAAILHDRCKSVYNVHTHESPIIQKFADFCNTHTGHFPILYSHKCQPYWHDSQQIPGYISDHWGQIMEQGGLRHWRPVRFLTSWMKDNFPMGSHFNLRTFCLFKRKASLSRALKFNAASRFDAVREPSAVRTALCSYVLIKGKCGNSQTSLEQNLEYMESWGLYATTCPGWG